MPTDIPNELRRLVTERAQNRCEYCLLPEKASLHKHEPDHIQLDGAIIQPQTAIARVTVKILCINDEARVKEREQLQKAGLFE